MKELEIISQSKHNNYRFFAQLSEQRKLGQFSENWKRVKEENKICIKISFYKKMLISKNIKEIWKIVHGGVLNTSKKTLKVDTDELNKYLSQQD